MLTIEISGQCCISILFPCGHLSAVHGYVSLHEVTSDTSAVFIILLLGAVQFNMYSSMYLCGCNLLLWSFTEN